MAASGSCLSEGETLNKASTDGSSSVLGQIKRGLSSPALSTLHRTIWGILYPAPVSVETPSCGAVIAVICLIQKGEAFIASRKIRMKPSLIVLIKKNACLM